MSSSTRRGKPKPPTESMTRRALREAERAKDAPLDQESATQLIPPRRPQLPVRQRQTPPPATPTPPPT
ncbi:MAG: hypothetical protein FWD59_04660, partial [Micrococcales bacterium]|nr:hypothetical protein [Micrococcales bacterium]